MFSAKVWYKYQQELPQVTHSDCTVSNCEAGATKYNQCTYKQVTKNVALKNQCIHRLKLLKKKKDCEAVNRS